MFWWLKAGTKTLEDTFKHNIPGIICWHVWKVYSNHLWGKGNCPTTSGHLLAQIKTYVQQWIYSLNNLRLAKMGELLVEEELIPKGFRLSGRRFHLIKWCKPNRGLKLNTDASYHGSQATGGAIMRNNCGKMMFGICFPVAASSPLEAELKTLLLAISWAIRAGYENFQVESDSSSAISLLLDEDARRWRNEIQETRLSVQHKNVSFRHVMREGNWAAHFLAASGSAQLQIFYNTMDLPIRAKRAYLMDFFGLPS
ncbi:unnamed protein product, partial [Cuscuta europaea]